MILAIAGGEADSEFDSAVLGQVERRLAEPGPRYGLPGTMARVLERFGAPDGGKALGLTEQEELGEVDVGKLRRSWSRARRRLGIPRVAPAAEPPGERPGVGSRTSS